MLTKIFQAKHLLFCGMFLAMGFFGGGVAGAEAATINAESNSYEDVQAAISSAMDGDVINVPAGNGSVTWSNQLVFPEGKTIHLSGPGRDLLTVTGTSILFGKTDSKLTGFSFHNTTVSSSGRGFVIGDCNFIHDSNARTIIVTGTYDGGDRSTVQWPRGLIYNSLFDKGGILVRGTAAMYSDDMGRTQNYLMAEDYNPLSGLMGTLNMVYVEDCTFKITSSNWVDTNYGGGYVARFNQIIGGTNSEIHGVQGGNRAAKWYEIYRNRTDLIDSSRWTAHFLRSGSAVVFDNLEEGSKSFNSYILLDYQRQDTTSITGSCDGTKAWDGNEIPAGQPGAGWPCLDQIGVAGDQYYRGSDLKNPGTLIKMPMYLWNNGRNGNDSFRLQEADIVNRYHVIENRDYYKSSGQGSQINPNSPFDGSTGVGYGLFANRPSTCTIGVAYWATDQGNWNKTPDGEQGVLYKCTSENTWEKYYEPYTYPHPLRLEDPPTPEPIPGDLNKDGTVNIFDYNIFLQHFGQTDCGNVADLDDDCNVDIFDYNVLLENFGTTSQS